MQGIVVDSVFSRGFPLKPRAIIKSDKELVTKFMSSRYQAVLRIRILRIRMFSGLQDPDPNPLVKGMDPDPDPDPSITKQK